MSKKLDDDSDDDDDDEEGAEARSGPGDMLTIIGIEILKLELGSRFLLPSTRWTTTVSSKSTRRHIWTRYSRNFEATKPSKLNLWLHTVPPTGCRRQQGAYPHGGHVRSKAVVPRRARI